ncbi:MAG: hypothetical protein WA461_12130 [Nitrososphaeraceae archaeon]
MDSSLAKTVDNTEEPSRQCCTTINRSMGKKSSFVEYNNTVLVVHHHVKAATPHLLIWKQK